VIAIIPILASLILSTFDKVKRSMFADQSKIKSHRYALGLNAYDREYGYCPQILSQGTTLGTDSVITRDADSSKNLIRALSGREIDGVRALLANEYLNPNGTQFAEFLDDHFFTESNGTINGNWVADRFNNLSFHLIVENDSDDNAMNFQSAFNDHRGSKKFPAPPRYLSESVNYHKETIIIWKNIND
jgi:hypothetical protein